jgi:hypothetical protein
MNADVELGTTIAAAWAKRWSAQIHVSRQANGNDEFLSSREPRQQSDVLDAMVCQERENKVASRRYYVVKNADEICRHECGLINDHLTGIQDKAAELVAAGYDPYASDVIALSQRNGQGWSAAFANSEID